MLLLKTVYTIGVQEKTNNNLLTWLSLKKVACVILLMIYAKIILSKFSSFLTSEVLFRGEEYESSSPNRFQFDDPNPRKKLTWIWKTREIYHLKAPSFLLIHPFLLQLITKLMFCARFHYLFRITDFQCKIAIFVLGVAWLFKATRQNVSIDVYLLYKTINTIVIWFL